MASCQTPVGVRKEGDCENERNLASSDLFKAIMREAFEVEDVICGHHIIYENSQRGTDGFTYNYPQEIPSADALIFNHDVARKIWGERNYIHVLKRLAIEPTETRDHVLRRLYNDRQKTEEYSYTYGGDGEPKWEWGNV